MTTRENAFREASCIHRRPALPFKSVGRLQRLRITLFNALRRWQRIRRNRRELHELDERLLRDIGMTHADVEALTGIRIPAQSRNGDPSRHEYFPDTCNGRSTQ